MAKTHKLVVTVGRTLSDNNYGSYRVDVTEEVILEDGDDRDVEFKAARRRCVADVETALTQAEKNLKRATK